MRVLTDEDFARDERILLEWFNITKRVVDVANEYGVTNSHVAHVWERAKQVGKLPRMHRQKLAPDYNPSKYTPIMQDADHGAPNVGSDPLLEKLRLEHPERMKCS